MSAAVPPPDHVAPWVEALGEEMAIEVFLALGGSRIVLAYRPENSRLAEIVGRDKAAGLARRLSAGGIEVPIPKAWIAQVWAGKGKSVQETARTLHVDARNVRRALAKMPGGRSQMKKDKAKA